jgi:hypothetical protein
MPRDRRFIPDVGHALEARVVAAHGLATHVAHAVRAPHVAAAVHRVAPHKAAVHPARVPHAVAARTATPKVVINEQFAAFEVAFTKALSTFFASIPAGSAASSGTFDGYIITSTDLLSQQLVSYFNSLPNKLPANTPGTTSIYGSRAAIQTFIQQQITGTSTNPNQFTGAPNNLQTNLLNVPLPSTVNQSAADLYIESADQVIEATRLQILDGVQALFKNGAPVNFNTSSTSSSGSSSSGSSSPTSGTG